MKKKKELKEALLPLMEQLGMRPIEGIKIATLDDEIKVNHLLSVWDKYTSYQLESLLA